MNDLQADPGVAIHSVNDPKATNVDGQPVLDSDGIMRTSHINSEGEIDSLGDPSPLLAEHRRASGADKLYEDH